MFLYITLSIAYFTNSGISDVRYALVMHVITITAILNFVFFSKYPFLYSIGLCFIAKSSRVYKDYFPCKLCYFLGITF